MHDEMLGMLQGGFAVQRGHPTSGAPFEGVDLLGVAAHHVDGVA